jgi:hypothetical protein
MQVLMQGSCGAQINYPAIGVFMNATISPLPWWPKREGLTFKWALTARAGMEDRTHPRWWYPDVPQEVLAPVDSMEAVLEFVIGSFQWLLSSSKRVGMHGNIANE